MCVGCTAEVGARLEGEGQGSALGRRWASVERAEEKGGDDGLAPQPFDASCPETLAAYRAERSGNVAFMVEQVEPLIVAQTEQKTEALLLALTLLAWRRPVAATTWDKTAWSRLGLLAQDAPRFLLRGRFRLAGNYLSYVPRELSRILRPLTLYPRELAVGLLTLIGQGSDRIRAAITWAYALTEPNTTHLTALGEFAYDRGRLEAGCCYHEASEEKLRCPRVRR